MTCGPVYYRPPAPYRTCAPVEPTCSYCCGLPREGGTPVVHLRFFVPPAVVLPGGLRTRSRYLIQRRNALVYCCSPRGGGKPPAVLRLRVLRTAVLPAPGALTPAPVGPTCSAGAYRRSPAARLLGCDRKISSNCHACLLRPLQFFACPAAMNPPLPRPAAQPARISPQGGVSPPPRPRCPRR